MLTIQALVGVSTCVTHMRHYATDRPTYGVTKLAGTDYLQQIALEVEPEEMQITLFHPGVIFTEVAVRVGLDDSSYDWDDGECRTKPEHAIRGPNIRRKRIFLDITRSGPQALKPNSFTGALAGLHGM